MTEREIKMRLIWKVTHTEYMGDHSETRCSYEEIDKDLSIEESYTSLKKKYKGTGARMISLELVEVHNEKIR